MSIDRIPIPSTDGTLWLCGRNDIAPDPDAVLITTESSTVVCLTQESELATRYPAYVEWLRANGDDGGKALWFPIANFNAESADATMPFLAMVKERLEAGEGVVMHCALGQGRAGTMAVCLLMMLGATQYEALETVAANRVFAGPADSAQWTLVEDVARATSAS